MKIRWREAFKFLSGAAFAGSVANAYLWLAGVSVTFAGFTITPNVFALRAIVGFAAFVVFFYFGWLKESRRDD